MSEIVKYSLDEISKNNGKDGSKVWIIVRNNVYDVTDYLDEHPGGGDLITEWAGKDGTKAFDDFGHSGDAKKDLKKYKIGELRDEDIQSGKKPKKTESPKVVESKEDVSSRSCIAVLTCGLCG